MSARWRRSVCEAEIADQGRHGDRAEFTGFFALGLVLVSKTRSNRSHPRAVRKRSGQLGGRYQPDLVDLLRRCGVVVAVPARPAAVLFRPDHARSIGINTGFLHYLLLSVLSLAAVAGLQTVGIILVVAMLVTPGATAYCSPIGLIA